MAITQQWMIELAHKAAEPSKDPHTKVGAVVSTPDHRNISVGYNGFAAGAYESPALWQRPEKYERVIHAEINALGNADFITRGCYLYITMTPCHKCLPILFQFGIKHIYFDKWYERENRKDIRDEYLGHFEHVEQICLS